MTVKDLITILLDMDMDSTVSVVYPEENLRAGNYYRYNQRDDFSIVNSASGVLIGVDHADK